MYKDGAIIYFLSDKIIEKIFSKKGIQGIMGFRMDPTEVSLSPSLPSPSSSYIHDNFAFSLVALYYTIGPIKSIGLE